MKLHQPRQFSDSSRALCEGLGNRERPWRSYLQLPVIASNQLDGLQFVDGEEPGRSRIEAVLRAQVFADPRIMLQGRVVL